MQRENVQTKFQLIDILANFDFVVIYVCYVSP